MRTIEYNSFEEIDKSLKILNLKREINKENVKLGLQRVKIDLYASNLIGEAKGLMQQYMLAFTVKNLRRLIRLS